MTVIINNTTLKHATAISKTTTVTIYTILKVRYPVNINIIVTERTTSISIYLALGILPTNTCCNSVGKRGTDHHRERGSHGCCQCCEDAWL